MTANAVKTIVRRQTRTAPSSFKREDGQPIHPLLARIFSCREINSPAELDHSLQAMIPPDEMKGIDVASKRILQAVEQDQSILIVGDYDTDGATASALAILGLGLLGAENVDYLVPNRFDYGYGLSEEIAGVAIEREPDLVITVDNGISSVHGVARLQRAGIDVIVTDHHLPGDTLPDAFAIVNPNQPGCAFPSKMLAGVGVMFYLLLAVRGLMRRENWFASRKLTPPNLAVLLDLVALGTVADVVPLDHNNRILVAQGIARIQKGACRPGIISLLLVGGKEPENITSADLGFVVAPRLNAAGRLDDISMGIECLLARSESIANECAQALHDINTQRKKIESEMQNQALQFVEELGVEGASSGLCLFDPGWHRGITGLVASRVKDRFNQPVIAFAGTGDEKMTGSARSIPGLHIRDLLERISSQHQGLIDKFGGHAMAAGLTIGAEDFARFSDLYQKAVAAHFEEYPPQNLVYTDGPLEPEFYTTEVAEMLNSAAPWGQKFPQPLFDDQFIVLQQRVVGEQHLKLRLKTRDRLVDAIAFRQLEAGQQAPQLERIKAAFRLDINAYRGTRSLQLIIDYLEPLDA